MAEERPAPARSAVGRSLASALVVVVAVAVGGCGSAGPSPREVAARQAAATDLAELQNAPLAPAEGGAVMALLDRYPGGPMDSELRRALLAESSLPLRLIGRRSEHPAVDVLRERAATLGEEGVDPGILLTGELDRSLARLAELRRALDAAGDADVARRLRSMLSEAAVEAEVLSWRLAWIVVGQVGGSLVDRALLDTLPQRLLDDPRRLLAELEPAEPDYRQLVAAYNDYRRMAAAAPDQPSPIADDARWRALRPGRSDRQRVPVLRARLAAEELYDGPPPEDPARFDAALVAALKAFQHRYGLDPDGRLGRRTLRALAVPLAERAAQLAAVLQHRRRDPARRDPYRIQVNIPAFELRVFRERRTVSRHRVVVGGAGWVRDETTGRTGRLNQTPTLASRITHVVLNPTWRVPRRIKELELDVQAAEKPGVYDGFELWTDDAGVEWAMQKPGPGNALGRVKFLFAGGDGVYLHDTPDKRVFRRSYRAVSHGCVRVDGALDLAREVITADQPAMSWARARHILASLRETPVVLNDPVPVYLEYVTAGIADDGDVRFYTDIYDRGPVVSAAEEHSAASR